ncbi:MAG: tetratricopeptide repeat protein [Sandaracinaceae bacterium]|nr:tetratricopeptide repeat protein [Sandaracinaceae bacterium]MDW8245166.1 tetratricopeptide repeat protein [Sandaracinaceae bacterium]
MRLERNAWVIGVGCLLVGAFESRLCAQGAIPPRQGERNTEIPRGAQDEEARRRFLEGRSAYEAGNYEEALRLFEEAYRLSPRPALLYNIGQAADRLRFDERALQAFEAYLEVSPQDAPNRAEVEKRIPYLRRRIEGDSPPNKALIPESSPSHTNPTSSALPQPSVLSQPSVQSNRTDESALHWIFGIAGVTLLVGGALVMGALIFDPGASPPPKGDVGDGGIVAALKWR